MGSGGRARGTLLLLVFTVIQAPQVGWTAPRALLSFAAVVVLLTASCSSSGARRARSSGSGCSARRIGSGRS
ncbi:hypothetical protein [Streptomyces sp. OV198]|uniref:hypothetical protein n=1 Tax=Streptomyces sp. OV198 TaxID=1882787 RepID=UPI000BE334EE